MKIQSCEKISFTVQEADSEKGCVTSSLHKQQCRAPPDDPPSEVPSTSA